VYEHETDPIRVPLGDGNSGPGGPLPSEHAHPAWCKPAHCRAYGYPGFEPYHRSEPVLIGVARDEVFALFLSAPAERAALTHVEIVALPGTPDGPPWSVEHVCAEISVPLAQAGPLWFAIRRLLRETTS
jgi:hypothetical protein